MNNEKKIVFQLEDNALPHTTKTEHLFSCDFLDRGIESSHDKRAADANSLDRLIEHSLAERFDINRNVG